LRKTAARAQPDRNRGGFCSLCGRSAVAAARAAQNVTQVTAMHPLTQYDLIKAQVADLHRQAERDGLARAGRRVRRERGRHPVLSHPATTLARHALATVGARCL
jgi:hypothetical protein